MLGEKRLIQRKSASNNEAITDNDTNNNNTSNTSTPQNKTKKERNSFLTDTPQSRSLSRMSIPNEASMTLSASRDNNYSYDSLSSGESSFEMESCEIGDSQVPYSTPTKKKVTEREEAAIFFPSLPHTPSTSFDNKPMPSSSAEKPSSPQRNETLADGASPLIRPFREIRRIRPSDFIGDVKPGRILRPSQKRTSETPVEYHPAANPKSSVQEPRENPVLSLFTRHRWIRRQEAPLTPTAPFTSSTYYSQVGTDDATTTTTADDSTNAIAPPPPVTMPPTPRRVTFRLPGNNSEVGSEFGSDTIEDVVISAIDHLEDEIDEHAYDELIPLSVRIALEENVFGWSHLLSDICGHVFFTLSAYFITYQFVTWALLRPVSASDLSDDSIDGDSGADCHGKIGCLLYGTMLHTHVDSETVQPSSAADSSSLEYDDVEYMPIFGMSYDTFTYLRFFLSAMAAINAFRTVRRRRKVWLRAPYGTREYMNDVDHRRADLEEADRTTMLGRIRSRLGEKRDAILANRVRKKIRKAMHRFERRRKHRAKQLASGLTHHQAAHHHHRVRVLSESGTSVTGAAEQRRRRKLETSKRESGRGGVIYHQTHDPHLGRPGIDSHTLPTFVMQSIAHDQIRFHSGYIDNVPYAHGGYFGAAPFLLANPYWVDVLRNLMPDVYVEISRRVVYAPAPKLIHWAENNPVMAAYGTAHELEYSGKVSTVEWDVFLDPTLVRRLEIVLSERDKFLKSRGTVSRQENNDRPLSPTSPTSPPTAADTAHSEFSITTENERTILRYYNNEIKRRTDVLLDRMLIAHGNLTQLILEQTGYLKHYNFSRVKRTRRTLGGGIYARQWLAVYAEALKMGMGGGEVSSEAAKAEGDDADSGIFLPKLSGEGEEESTSCASTFPSSGNSTPRSFSPSPEGEFNNEAIPLLDIPIDGGDSSPLRQIQSSGCDSYEERKKRSDATSDSESFSTSPCMRASIGGDVSSDADTANHVDSAQLHNVKLKRKKKQGCYKEGDYYYCDGSCMQHNDDDVGGNFSFEQQRITNSKQKEPEQIKPSPSSEADRRKSHPTSLSSLSRATCPTSSIPNSIALLKKIMKCNAPFGLILDIKSRHVPKRVWAIVIDALRDAGARVEGIGSFSIEDIRDISAYCSSPVKEICFFHSAGDLQAACHEGKLKRGDSVFFNAGSLIWDKPDYDYDTVKDIFTKSCCSKFSTNEVKRGYKLMPYARILYGPKSGSDGYSSSGCESSFDSDLDTDDASSTSSTPSALRTFIDEPEEPNVGCSTIQDYKEYYGLSIGLYCQEFAIDDAAIDLLVAHVNENPHVYDLGLSWGGINGVTVRGIQPGRFTNTDGLWNQRYAGLKWDTTKFPPVDEL